MGTKKQRATKNTNLIVIPTIVEPYELSPLVRATRKALKRDGEKRTERQKTTAGIVDNKQTQMFNEWSRGTPIHQLVKDYAPLSRSKCRQLLTLASGGKSQFQALRAKGAGGGRAKREDGMPSSRRTSISTSAISVPSIDDSRVPMTASMNKSDGWIFTRQRDRLIVTSPEGRSYTHAADTQPADLIHIGIGEGLPNARLRRYEFSGVKEATKRDEAEAIEVATQVKAQRSRKRLKREARKSRKTSTDRTR